jgi:D-glycero-alpha-D-manno-heptose-7-phosphate kinase
MVLTRTPFRISFFGGGTDYPAWFDHFGDGETLSATIDKYCYLACRAMPPFFEKKSRVVWSKIELVDHPDEIEHPTVRETLKHLGMEEDGVEIHHYGDLPARSGMGSSSSFVVGLLHALHALRGSSPQKHDLAMDAIHIERVRAGSHVGFQDQVAAAYGGFNHATYHAGGVVTVRPLALSPGSLEYFNDRLMMFFTGLTRTASEIAHEQINATPQKERELRQMRDIVARACAHIESPSLTSMRLGHFFMIRGC